MRDVLKSNLAVLLVLTVFFSMCIGIIFSYNLQLEKEALENGEKTKIMPDQYATPLKPNVTQQRTECCAPLWIHKTNRYGLREENFSTKNPDNTTRILVIGDAYTWGFGVNESDRFTEILESKLNNNRKTRYQVINAGIPNWGMENYYNYFKYQGVNFEPDILVVAFIWNDRFSEKEYESLYKKAEKQVIDNVSENLSADEVKTKINRRFGQLESEHYEEVPTEETGFKYLDNLDRIAEKNDVRQIYYAIDNVHPKDRRYIVEWASESNETFIQVPDKFSESKNRMVNGIRVRSPYRISPWNTDPNIKGHKIIARELHRQVFKLS